MGLLVCKTIKFLPQYWKKKFFGETDFPYKLLLKMKLFSLIFWFDGDNKSKLLPKNIPLTFRDILGCANKILLGSLTDIL